MTALPTRKLEDWRYSDIDAVARVWPVAAEALHVAAGTSAAHMVAVAAFGLAAKEHVDDR